MNRPIRPRGAAENDPFALDTKRRPAIPAPMRLRHAGVDGPEPSWDAIEAAGEPPAAPRRVLLVEDDPRVASLLDRALRREGYQVDLATTGQDALTCGLENRYSAILMDVMIPAPDGVAVVRRMRRCGQWAPVLMLTARDGVENRVAGLHAGADDYLTKPFSVAEVLTRVYALIRRGDQTPPTLQVGDLTLDQVTGRVARGEVSILLCGREFDLLQALMRHPGHILTRAYLRAHALPGRLGGDSTALAEQVARLRERIDIPFGRTSIQAVGLEGYRIVDDRAVG